LERKINMRYQAIQDDRLMVEAYEQLLLETPATNANIERFLKKYYKLTPTSTPRPGGHNYQSLVPFATDFLNDWTPRVQQIIKASGGNPDIFGYPNPEALLAALESAQISKTDIKKSYKKVKGMEKIHETDQFVFFKPQNWEASRKYFGMPKRVSLLDGKLKPGAPWCTSSSDPKFFTAYVEKHKNRLIYIIHKPDDALWAVRSKTIEENKSNTIFNHFTQELLQYITYMEVNGSEDGTEYEDYGDISAYDQLVVDAINDIEIDVLRDIDYSMPLIEVRDQQNNNYTLTGMISKYFINIKDEKDVIDRILPFIGLVVFGKKY